MTNSDRLQDIKERWAKATPGPWGNTSTAEDVPVVYVQLEVPDAVSVLFEADWGTETDAKAIAAAPADVAWLVREVERLQQENADLREAMAQRARASNRMADEYRETFIVANELARELRRFIPDDVDAWRGALDHYERLAGRD